MLDGIQRDSTQHPRRRISAQVSHPRVGRFMHTDGEYEGQYLKQNLYVMERHSGLVMDSPVGFDTTMLEPQES